MSETDLPDSLISGHDPMRDFREAMTVHETAVADHFTSAIQWQPHGRVFGGQVLAQSLLAASATLPDDRPVHSLHGYFLRPGDMEGSLDFAVDRIHDGRSFSTRRTQCVQHGAPIFSMIASFQAHDDGLTHAEPMPDGIPEPEDLPDARSLLATVDHPIAQVWAGMRPFDFRHVDGAVYDRISGEPTAVQAVWCRSLETLPDDPVLHAAALAYASDFTVLEPVLRRHSIPWTTPGLKLASLDHAMWFHREVRVDEWFLFVHRSPSAQGGRGLSLGHVYRRNGELVATLAQEGMVRLSRE